MKNLCECCGSQIRFQHVMKNNFRSTIKCENCHETLKITSLSRFLFSAIFLIPFAIMLLGIESVGLKLLVVIPWITICLWVIQPFMIRYEKPDTI